MGSSHLSLVGEPYKYPLGVKVSITFWCKSCLPPLKIKSLGFLPSKTHSLECQDCGSSYYAKDLGCIRPPDSSSMFFMLK